MNTNDVMPLNNKVLIKVNNAEERTNSGIIIPKTSQHQRESKTAIVLNHGTSTLVEDGDKIVFEAYNAVKLELHEYENNDILLIDDKNILAKVY